jgi:ADP-ribose pyrophosphatase
MLKELHHRSTSVRYVNPYWEYRVDVYTKPSGSDGEYHYVHTPGSVMVVPQLEDGRFVLTRQYRYLNRRVSLEFAGGGLPRDTQPEVQAGKELHEETGLRASALHALGTFCPFNGVTDEMCFVFFAEGAIKHELPAKPDESEEFEIVAMSAQEIVAAISSGNLFDGMSLAAWQLFTVSRFATGI